MLPVLFFVVPIAAGILPPPPPSPDAQQEAQQPEADEFAFGTVEARMTVPVTIGRRGPYPFIVDTGAQRTVISRELAGTLGLAPGRMVGLTAMAGSATVATVIIPEISVGTGAHLRGSRIEAPALVQRYLGAAGLVGIDTLQGHAVTIDFARQSMTVVPATKQTRREHFGPSDIVIRAKSQLGQLIFTDATYRGTRIRVIIDTGSVVSMGNLALRRLAARGTARQMEPVRLLSVTGAFLTADYTRVDEVRLGDIIFRSLPVAFSDAPPFARLGLVARPAMLLGMDALRQFGKVRIDFANREIRLAELKTAP